MEILVILLVLVVLFVYSVPKLNAKYGNAQPQKTSTNSGSSKPRGVRWECDKCGNDWIVREPVPDNYKSKKLNENLNPSNLWHDKTEGRPWVCSDCNSYTDTHPQK